MDYYFPYFRGTGITIQEDVSDGTKHADKESFAGVCDDMRVGVTSDLLSCRMLMNICRAKGSWWKMFQVFIRDLVRSLQGGKDSVSGAEKDKEQVAGATGSCTQNRMHADYSAARNGDEEAMESLTMDDMDTYSMISRRIVIGRYIYDC